MKRLGLITIIFGFIFWYGLSYLHPAAVNLFTLQETNILIFSFVALTLIGYKLGYSRPEGDIKNQGVSATYVVGSRSFFFVTSLAATVTSLLIFLQGYGMISYHLLRAQVAIGILVFIFSLIFTGWRRILLFSLFIAISIYCLGAYSRRPFLTLLAPILLVSLIRNRYRIDKRILQGIIALVISLLGTLYVTGLRHLDETLSASDVLQLAQRGFFIFTKGEGFDTVWLTQYVLNSYDLSNFHYGSTFWGGVVNFIPRAMWEEKPIAFGVILASEYFGDPISDPRTNFGPGIVAEAYANGGYVLVFVVASVFGVLVGLADKRVEMYRLDWNWVLFGCIFYPAIFFIIRGDFLNGFYELYSKTLVAFAALKLTGLAGRLTPKSIH